MSVCHSLCAGQVGIPERMNLISSISFSIIEEGKIQHFGSFLATLTLLACMLVFADSLNFPTSFSDYLLPGLLCLGLEIALALDNVLQGKHGVRVHSLGKKVM